MWLCGQMERWKDGRWKDEKKTYVLKTCDLLWICGFVESWKMENKKKTVWICGYIDVIYR